MRYILMIAVLLIASCAQHGYPGFQGLGGRKVDPNATNPITGSSNVEPVNTDPLTGQRSAPN